jgi:lysozyme
VKTSQAGIELIKQFEGVRLESYVCPAGILTIGVGHTSAAGPPKVVPKMKITYQEANEILARDLVKYESAVDRLVTVPLSQNQFDALVSFTFNVGEGALAKSTLLKKLNAGKYSEVPAELMKWTKGGGRELPGLVRRRRAECALWRSVNDRSDIDVDEARVKPDPQKPAKTMSKSKEGNAAIFTGGAAALSAAGEVSRQVKDTGDSLTSVLDLVKDPTFLLLVAIVLAAGAIWYWRRQRLEETGE